MTHDMGEPIDAWDDVSRILWSRGWGDITASVSYNLRRSCWEQFGATLSVRHAWQLVMLQQGAHPEHQSPRGPSEI